MLAAILSDNKPRVGTRKSPKMTDKLWLCCIKVWLVNAPRARTVMPARFMANAGLLKE